VRHAATANEPADLRLAAVEREDRDRMAAVGLRAREPAGSRRLSCNARRARWRTGAHPDTPDGL
jgi:hypothetical protein